MLAERDASDRYKVSYMSKKVGETFTGTIVSLNEYGLFVSVNLTGVTGFVPIRNLQGDFFHYEKRQACFKGQRTGQTFTIGEAMIIRVQSANAITGSLIFEPAASVTRAAGPPRRFHHSGDVTATPAVTDKKRKKERHRDRKNKGKRRQPSRHAAE